MNVLLKDEKMDRVGSEWSLFSWNIFMVTFVPMGKNF